MSRGGQIGGRGRAATPLAERDVRGVLDLVGEAHDAQDLEDFRSVLVEGFLRLVRADYCSYNEVHADGRAPVSIVEPEVPPWAMAAWEANAGQNPLVQRFMVTRDGRAYRMSDVASRAEFRATTLFRELYEPLGLAHQLAFTLPSERDLIVGIALTRGGQDFSERDRCVVDLTRPHLIQAYRNAGLRERLGRLVDGLRRGLEVDGAPMILLDEVGRVSFASAAARALVESFAAGKVTEGDALPAPLRSWAAGDAASGSIASSRGGDALLVRRLNGTPEAAVVLLLERAGRVLSATALEALGLTPRESTVLHAFARGLETPEVAAELGIAPGTVYKHAERVHAKLGVRTRAQAVATAWAAAATADVRKTP